MSKKINVYYYDLNFFQYKRKVLNFKIYIGLRDYFTLLGVIDSLN